MQGTKQRKTGEPSNHLQSWFFGMRRNLIHSPVFDSFWKSITPLDKKNDVINAYEIGMTENFERQVSVSVLSMILQMAALSRTSHFLKLPHISTGGIFGIHID